MRSQRPDSPDVDRRAVYKLGARLRGHVPAHVRTFIHIHAHLQEVRKPHVHSTHAHTDTPFHICTHTAAYMQTLGHSGMHTYMRPDVPACARTC